MFGLTKIYSAITTLAANLTSLAGTVREINSGLRGAFRLDDHNDTRLVNEQPSQAVQALPDIVDTPATSPDTTAATTTGRNGRRSKQATLLGE